MFDKMKEKMNEIKKNNKGFTLMELIVVVAILGFLVAMLAPKYTNYTDKAMGVAAAADAKSVQVVAATWLMDKNAYPTIVDLSKEAGINTTTGTEKVLTGTGPAYIYTYKKNGITVTANINIDDSTIEFEVAGTGNAEKKARVVEGIGKNHKVTTTPPATP